MSDDDKLSMYILLQRFIEKESRNAKDMLDCILDEKESLINNYTNVYKKRLDSIFLSYKILIDSRNSGELDYLIDRNINDKTVKRRFTNFGGILNGQDIATLSDHFHENLFITKNEKIKLISEKVDVIYDYIKSEDIKFNDNKNKEKK